MFFLCRFFKFTVRQFDYTFYLLQQFFFLNKKWHNGFIGDYLTLILYILWEHRNVKGLKVPRFEIIIIFFTTLRFIWCKLKIVLKTLLSMKNKIISLLSKFEAFFSPYLSYELKFIVQMILFQLNPSTFLWSDVLAKLTEYFIWKHVTKENKKSNNLKIVCFSSFVDLIHMWIVLMI